MRILVVVVVLVAIVPFLLNRGGGEADIDDSLDFLPPVDGKPAEARAPARTTSAMPVDSSAVKQMGNFGNALEGKGLTGAMDQLKSFKPAPVDLDNLTPEARKVAEDICDRYQGVEGVPSIGKADPSCS